MTDQEKAMIFSGAQQQYIFNKIFADHNGGKIFDIESWMNDVEKITSDNLFAISPEKQEELAKVIENLDDYAVDANNLHSKKEKHEGPQLVL